VCEREREQTCVCAWPSRERKGACVRCVCVCVLCVCVCLVCVCVRCKGVLGHCVASAHGVCVCEREKDRERKRER